jgi:malto-oligosyltrehalose trehalohydrolase
LSARYAHALPFGAEVIGDRRVRFRVWAPSRECASVVFEDDDETPLAAETGGWFSAELDCAVGAGYRYRFDDDAPVPDPASRAQRGGVQGASVVVDPCAYAWRHADWRGRPWHEAVIYELHIGACGGYAGVRDHLPRLRKLGVTAIELMPVAESPGSRNWGYDGVLPFAPTCTYGSPDELKALIDDAHGHGLMVLLDVVYNHFGPEGNFLGRYAGAFFRGDLDTLWGRAIDFRRREVREFFIHNALYWIGEYRLDGLRLDAVHAIAPDDWLGELATRVREAAGPQRHVHLLLENDANSVRLLQRGFDAQWNDDFHHAVHVLLTGETDSYYRDYAHAPAQHLARCLAEGFAYQGEYSAHRDAHRGEASAQLAPTRFVAFLQNHDQVGNRAFGERLTELTPADALHAAAALLLLAPQIPLLWMGQEWDSRRPFLYFTDYHGELAQAVREGRCREFAAFAAFNDAASRERIPDPNDPATFDASIPDFDAADHGTGAEAYERYRELLAIRRREIVPYLADTRAIEAGAIGAAAVFALWRLASDRVLTIHANFGAEPVACPGPAHGKHLYQTREGDGESTRRGELPGYALVAWLQSEAPDVRR